ncbi:major cell-binding factor [Kordia sp. SMS9]|uniref:substrate-binding periplasmic protein n=1 Tax=Kordia sp. SMS9 TaxID=2282170 RepID=UPI000E0D8B9B|nr:transporter substrate-binding domain-containing protein [Kordia sp. SMS9]AXG71023.1 major cell-binding factor [Kordia sp. SMS9]
MKKNYILIFVFLCTLVGFAQDKEVIRLGVKKAIPDAETEDLIDSRDYNYVDAFEYEVLKLLKNYSEKSEQYVIDFVPVEQSAKSKEIKTGIHIDALLYTFSITEDRKKDTIHFSKPYFFNKAIGVITNNEDIDINNIEDSQIQIGVVEGTIPQDELNVLKGRNNTNLVIVPFKNHGKLIEALRSKRIQAAAGDVSRLIFDVNEGDFYFGGNLPTKRAKVKDGYGIGITPKKQELKRFFDDFVTVNQTEIEDIEEKWLSTAIEDAYQSYYNKDKSKLQTFIYYSIIGAVLFLLITGLVFYKVITSKNKKINKISQDQHHKKLNEVFSIYEKKGRANVDAEGIAEIGIHFFKNAKKITYVGSGGFLADPELGPKWSEALYEFLDKEETTLTRVVDFPEMCVDEENEISFDQTDNFFPQKLEDQYIYRYLKWVCIQYHCLQHYEDLKIHNSRGAALWGYGIVIMIKDDNEVLFFTTNKNTKIGSSIQDKILASQIYKVISDIVELGTAVNEDKFKKMFFMEDQRLVILKNKIDASTQRKLDPKLLKEIDKTCRDIAGL